MQVAEVDAANEPLRYLRLNAALSRFVFAPEDFTFRSRIPAMASKRAATMTSWNAAAAAAAITDNAARAE
jgi:hypothetical protein